MRLGEIGGYGSLGDAHFTRTKTWSINGYANAAFSGTAADGSYTAPTNIVIRLAPNIAAPERVTAVFDYAGNLIIGTGWATHRNTSISTTTQAIVLRAAPANPGALNLKFDKGAEQGISIQNSANDTGGKQILFQNTAGTVIGGVSGTATTIAYNTSSNRRLKTNIENAGSVGDIIDKLEVVSFEFRSAPGNRHVGFIAQDE